MKKVLSLFLSLMLLLVVTLSPVKVQAQSDNILQVHYIDVGQGDSIYIKYKDYDILIDAGETNMGDRVVNYIKPLVIGNLDLVIATHPHSDHIGGLPKVFQNFKVNKIIDSGMPYTTATYKSFMTEVNKQVTSGSVYAVKSDTTINIDNEVKLDIIDDGHADTNPNNNSVVAKLTYGKVSYLFTGDTEKESEALILNRDIKADILKVGHHGSRTASSLPFIQKVNPQCAIISCGLNNQFGHPHQETLDTFNSLKIPYYITMNLGNIIVTTDGVSFNINGNYAGMGRTGAVLNSINNAEIVSDTIPLAMEAGKTYTANVVLKNTGNNTWTSADNYRLGAVGDSDPFAETRIYMDNGESTAPGQKKTFTINITAPSAAGTYTTDWQMVQELVEWFGLSVTKTVAVKVPVLPNNAEIVSDTIPTNMESGKTYTANVVVKNIGSNTWTSADNYRLGAVGDSDPFAATRINMDNGESTAPGQTKTFTINITAPSVAGSYTTDWQMVQELVEWFGLSVTKTVNVKAAALPNNAEIVSDTIPLAMEPGKTYKANIVVKNTGSNTWTSANNFRLGAVGDSDPFAACRICMEDNESVGPGQTKTFTISMTAPSTEGVYTTDWQMVQELVEWFGIKTEKTINVKSMP